MGEANTGMASAMKKAGGTRVLTGFTA